MTAAPTKFNTNPSRTMVLIGKRPVENTIVLGAVATGNIKAQLALMAAGTMSSSGRISAANAAAAKTGSMRVVVAVLLVISVRKVIEMQMLRTTRMSCSVASADNHSPSRPDRPVATNALAMAIPPPNKIRTPQGMFAAADQSSRRPSLPLGTENMAMTANIAMLASLIP